MKYGSCRIGPGEGVTQIIFDEIMRPVVWNPYPYLRIFLPQKMADLTSVSKFKFNFPNNKQTNKWLVWFIFT